MLNLIKRLVREEEGQGVVEYGLIIGLVSIGLVVLAFVLKKPTADIFKGIGDWLTAQIANIGK